MPLDESETGSKNMVRVTIEKIVNGGNGLGRLDDGRAVFAPFVLPGEAVRLRLGEQKRGYARGDLLEVLTPHPQRIQPPCEYFGVCGGCHFQQMPYPMQLEIKREILRDQLLRIGGLDALEIAPVVPSPEEWSYRNHVQFHLTPDGKLGFVDAKGERVVAVHECRLLKPALVDLWGRVAFDADTGLNKVILRSSNTGDRMIILESDDPQPIAFSTDAPVSVVYRGPGGEMVLAGDEAIETGVLGQLFRISASAYYPMNDNVATAMVTQVLEHLALNGNETVIDAYCGAGIFSAFLAERAKAVIGIESSPAACADFQVNLDRFGNVALYEAPVENVLPALNVHPDVVVLDPPRAGLDRKVVDALGKLSPERLVSISRDAATLARDARRLASTGFEMKVITPFDTQPQTQHFESIVFWEKSRPVE